MTFGKLFLLRACLCIPTGALAAPVLQGPTNAATGIHGLEILGMTYNVEFSNAGSFDMEGENPPTFLDQDNAITAATAITNFLNGTATGITDQDPTDSHEVLVPFTPPKL